MSFDLVTWKCNCPILLYEAGIASAIVPLEDYSKG